MRRLSAEEQALWSRVTASIRPLSRDPADGNSIELANEEISPPSAVSRVVKAPSPVRSIPPPPPLRHAIANRLDGGWDRRLKAGGVEPDRVVDLHGHNLDQAWAAIDRALETAIARGERLVVLITGHARPGDPPVERGKIRAAVNDWLAASRHAGRIAAVRQAHRRHGGGGSLYIVLRR